MEKLKMHSPNLTQENIAQLRELFPGNLDALKLLQETYPGKVS